MSSCAAAHQPKRHLPEMSNKTCINKHEYALATYVVSPKLYEVAIVVITIEHIAK